MFKKYILILVFIFLKIHNYSFAQTSWTVGLQCNAVSFANSVVQTKDKGYFVGGNGQSIIEEIWGAYVTKLDSAGNAKWTIPLGEYCNAVNLANDGGYVVVGNTSPGETTGGYDVYVNKLDSSGNIQWSKDIGGIRDEVGYSVIPTNEGGYAVAGYTASFFLADTNVYVIKLNSAGNIQWSKTIGGTNPVGEDIGYAITQTKDKGYAITGSTTSFGAGGEDVYVIKLDSSGNLQWTKTIGGRKNDRGNAIIQSRDGGYAITGVTYSYADTAKGDVYIVKLDSLGNLKWTTTVGGTSYDVGYTISQAGDGDYAITGTTSSYGGGATITYYIKLDSLGNVTETRTYGVPTDATINFARETKSGSFAAVGSIPVYNREYLLMVLDSGGNNCSALGSGGSIDSGGIAGSGGIITTSDSGRVQNVNGTYYAATSFPQTYICSKNGGGLTVAPTVANTYCKNYPDGTIILAVSGGYSPYTYSWSPNVSDSSSATGLSGGTYTVTVKDSLNDITTMLVPLYYSSPVYANCYATNQTCNGNNNGSVSIATQSGTPPLTYSWSNGGTSSTDSNLIAGTYILTLTDSCGSSFIDTFNIALVTDLRDSIISITNVSCNNGNDGIATVGVKGSSPPFTYLWSDANHQTTATAMGLVAGTYTATVTDACGGTGASSAIITMPDPLQVNISSLTNVSCGGASDGSATSNLNVSLAYSFEPVVQHLKVPPSVTMITISIAGAQGAGIYGGPGASFIGTCPVIPGDILSIAVGQQGSAGGGGASWVYDSNIVLYSPIDTIGLIAVAGGGGAEGSTSIEFFHDAFYGGPGGNNLITHATIDGSYPDRNGGIGGNGGNAGVVGAGGGGWLSNGQNTAYWDSGGRDEANHFATVVLRGGGYGGGGGSAYQCHASHCAFGAGGGGGFNGGGAGYGGQGGGSYFVNTLPIVQDSEHGNGFVKIYYVITGSDSSYKYSWSNGETTSTASGLSAGTYTLTVSDKNGCSATTSVIITQPTPMMIVSDSVIDNGSCNGEASVTVSGGFSPYSYLWTGGLTTDTIKNQCAGYYCCIVTDTHGCEDSTCITINLATSTRLILGENRGITVYPNPTSGKATLAISYKLSANYQIEIYNVFGERVYALVSQESMMSLDLSSQPSGLYFYRALNKNLGVIGEGKIVIEK